MRLHQNRVVQTAANTSISPLLLQIIAIAAPRTDYLMPMRLVASPDPTVYARSSPKKKLTIIAVALGVTTKLPNLVAQRRPRRQHRRQRQRQRRRATKRGAGARVATGSIVIGVLAEPALALWIGASDAAISI